MVLEIETRVMRQELVTLRLRRGRMYWLSKRRRYEWRKYARQVQGRGSNGTGPLSFLKISNFSANYSFNELYRRY